MVEVSPGEFCGRTSEYAKTASSGRLGTEEFYLHFWAKMRQCSFLLSVLRCTISLLSRVRLQGVFCFKSHLNHRLFPNFNTNFPNIDLAGRNNTLQYSGNDFTFTPSIDSI
jgi:hypothetical protein